MFAILFSGTAAYASTAAAHFSGVQTSIGSGFSGPSGVAVDSSGNVYIADSGHGLVKELLAASGYTTINTLGGGFTQPNGIAVDASGNVFVGDVGVGVKEIPFATCINPPNTNDASCVVTFAGSFPDAQGLAVDASGNVYVADPDFGSVKEILKAGGYTTINSLGSGFSNLQGVAVDASGNVFLTDNGNNAVKEILAAGGYATTNILATGAGVLEGIGVDSAGNVFYDDFNLATAQEIKAVGGSIPASPTIVSVGASIGSSEGLVVDSHDNIFIASISGSTVWEIQLGAVNFGALTVPTISSPSTLLFTFTNGGSINPPVVLPLATPAVPPGSGSGINEFADAGTGSCTTTSSFTTGQTCAVNLTFTPEYPGQRIGAVELLDTGSDILASVDVYGTGIAPLAAYTPGTISTVAGVAGQTCVAPAGTSRCGDGGSATTLGATLNAPTAVAVDAGGDIYIADQGDNVIRKVSTANIINTVAGGGTTGSCGSGTLGDGCLATLLDSTQLVTPDGVAVDAAGDIYIADGTTNLIREVIASSGIITTVAGGGTTPGTCSGSTDSVGDGCVATQASLHSPHQITLDGAGNLYIADTSDDLIRKVTASSSIITAVAGNGTACSIGSAPFCGDGGLATAAQVKNPSGVAVDAAGDLYIADTSDDLVREVSALTGIITTVAGNGTACADFVTSPFPPAPNCGDSGPAISAKLKSPGAVALDAAGDLYISDSTDNIVRRVDPSGIITTVAGNGTYGTFGDNGPATAAFLGTPAGITTDEAGDIFITDLNGNVIRKVDVTSAASVVFSDINSPSTELVTAGPIFVTLYNPGNSPLAILSELDPGTPSHPNPFITDPNFSLDSGTTNPCNIGAGSGGDYDLVAGAGCLYALDFTPQFLGALSGQVDVFDNSGNATPYTVQVISVSGYSAPPQTILFPTPSDQTFVGPAPFTVFVGFFASDNVAGDPEPITYSLVGGTGTGHFINDALEVTQVGTFIIQADQIAGGGYPAAASVQATLTVDPGTQTINWSALPNPTYAPGLTQDFSSFATDTGGGSASITFSVVPGGTGVGTFSGSVLTVTQAGTFTIEADQAADINFAAASPATTTFTVFKASQTIDFTAPASPVIFGVSPITLTATATSGLTVTFSIVGGGASGSISGNVLTVTGAGGGGDFIRIEADQAGDANYLAVGPPSQQSIVVNTQRPTLGTVSFSPASSVLLGTNQDITISDSLSYTGAEAAPSGGLTFNWAGTPYTASCSGSTSPLTCTAVVPGADIAALPPSTDTVTAAYAGDSNYTARTDNTGSVFTVHAAIFELGAFHIDPFYPGQTGAGLILIPGNAGDINTSGTITVTDTLPIGMNYTGFASVDSMTGDPSTPGTGWTCGVGAGVAGVSSGVVTCTTNDVIAPPNFAPNEAEIIVNIDPSAVPGTPLETDQTVSGGSGVPTTDSDIINIVQNTFTVDTNSDSVGSPNCVLGHAANSCSLREALSEAGTLETSTGDGIPAVVNFSPAASGFGSLGIGAINITNGGSGYSSAPAVTINGDGSGATATASINAGVVTSITVTNPGSGYTAATAAIAAPTSGTTATAVAVVNNVISTGSALTVPTNTTVQGFTSGSGATLRNLITLNAGAHDTVINVTDNTATGIFLNNLNITNGNGGSGGISNAGALTIASSSIYNNTASSSGGGIENTGTLTINDSTLSGNTSAGGAGGIDNGGTLTLNYTTITGNTAAGNGGGIALGGAGGTINNSTITGNTANLSGGVEVLDPLSLNNSIIEGNAGVSGQADIFAGATITASGSVYSTDGSTTIHSPGLSALGSYGGPTQTFLALPGGASICAGLSAALPVGFTTDQRGDAQTATYGSNTCVDAGATQSNYSLAFVQQPSDAAVNAGIAPAPTVQLSENGSSVALAGVSVAAAFTNHSAFTAGTTSAATGSTGLAAFSNLQGNAVDTSETITASISAGSNPITAVSGTFNVTLIPQTITFTPPITPVAFGIGPITLVATGGGSGNTVTFTIDGSSTGTGSITGNVLTVTSAGTFVIDANQLGSATYAAATQVQRAIVVAKATQAITFTAPAATPDLVTYGVSSIQLTANGGSSGNAVTFTVDGSSTAGIATINGSHQVVVSGAGSIVIDANQLGNTNYSAAPQVQTIITVGKATPTFGTMTFSPASTETYGTIVAVTISDTVTYSGATAPMAANITYTLNGVGYSPSSCTGSSSPVTCSVIVPAATIAALPGAAYTVTAAFTADTNYVTTTGTSGTFTITEPAEAIWVVNSTGSLSELYADGTAQSNPNAPIAGSSVAAVFDHSGNIWSASSSGVVKYDVSGNLLSTVTGGGISSPTALAIDGLGNTWTANGTGSVSEIHAGTAITPTGGYVGGGLSSPNGIAVDTSGNVWVSNGGNNSVTEIVGGAPPTQPLATATEANTLGVRP